MPSTTSLPPFGNDALDFTTPQAHLERLRSSYAASVAFLRGNNLGKRRVTMSRLAEIFSSLGHARVSTFIASGNAYSDSSIRTPDLLEAEASRQLEAELAYPVDVFIRTAAFVKDLAAEDPFPGATTRTYNSRRLLSCAVLSPYQRSSSRSPPP